MSRITFIDNLDQMYRNKRQRWFIKRRALRMEKVIRMYNIQTKFESLRKTTTSVETKSFALQKNERISV